MAVTRRSSAAYASLVAFTSMQNSSRDRKRGSLAIYAKDEAIINGANSKPLFNFDEENSELPKISIEEGCEGNVILPCEIKDTLLESSYTNYKEMIDSDAAVLKNNKSVRCITPNYETTSGSVYENPLADELPIISTTQSIRSVNLFPNQTAKKSLTRRWSVSNINPKNEDKNIMAKKEGTQSHQSVKNESTMKNEDDYLLNVTSFRLKNHCGANNAQECSSKCLKSLCSLPATQSSIPSNVSSMVPPVNGCDETYAFKDAEDAPLICLNGFERVESPNMSTFQNGQTIMLTVSKNSESTSNPVITNKKHHEEKLSRLPDIGILMCICNTFKDIVEF